MSYIMDLRTAAAQKRGDRGELSDRSGIAEDGWTDTSVQVDPFEVRDRSIGNPSRRERHGMAQQQNNSSAFDREKAIELASGSI